MASRKKRIIKLEEHEHIIAVVPEYPSGPGWSNALIWVWIRDSQTNTVRSEDIQSEDFTVQAAALFGVVEAGQAALLMALQPLIVANARKKERR